jgi:phage terminase large subunit-like protein
VAELSQISTSTPRLSEVARHLVLPSGIVSTGWPSTKAECANLGLEFDPWQDGAGKGILAKRVDGIYAAGIGGVVISIPRQVGKTFLIGAIIFALCRMNPGMTAIWTAHQLRTAEETFLAMKAMAAKPKIAPHVKRVVLGSGEEAIEFVNRSRILFGARERGFGLGFAGVDVLVLDEAQRVTEKTMDDLIPTTNQAPNPLIFLIGTPPRPTDAGEVFTRARTEALSGESDDQMYLEFSADPNVSTVGWKSDRNKIDWAQVAKANPSHPRRTPRTAILRMLKHLGEDSFLREGLGVWDSTTANAVIKSTAWSTCLDSKSKVVGAAKFVLDVSPSRAWSSIAVAGNRKDGLPHVEITSRKGVIDHQPGVEWVVPRAVKLKKAIPGFALTLVSGSAAEPLIPALTAAGIPLEFVKAADLPAACGLFYDLVEAGDVRHVGQSVLTDALAAARKNVNDGEGAWRWGRKKSASDITPLYAATVALWALINSPPVEPSVYFL